VVEGKLTSTLLLKQHWLLKAYSTCQSEHQKALGIQPMDVPLTSPSYSCISKRAKSVEIKCRAESYGPLAHVVIDTTGLKVYGEDDGKLVSMAKKNVVPSVSYTLRLIVVRMKLCQQKLTWLTLRIMKCSPYCSTR